MTATEAATAQPDGLRRRNRPHRRNGLGVAALVVVLVAIAAPLLTWIVAAIVGSVQSSSVDDAVWVGVIGGGIIALGLASLLAPVAVVGVALGVASLFRRGHAKTPGVVAIVLGIVPSLFLAGLPLVLGEIIPD